MNDDEFLSQFQEPAPPEFVNTLYQKITRERSPMTQISTMTLSTAPLPTRRLRKNYALTLVAAVVAAVMLGSIGFALMRPQSPIFQTVPTNLVPITLENVERLTGIRQFGRGYISGAAWSPDGKWLTVASSTGLWQYDTSTFASPPNRIQDLHGTNLTYSPDGSLLAFSQEDNSVVVLDTQTYQVRYTLAGDSYPIGKLVFSPDNTQLAILSGTSIGENDRIGRINVRLLETSERVFEMVLVGDRIVTALFPPEEDTVLFVSEQSIHRWKKGEETQIMQWAFTGMDNRIHSAVLTPDGKQMISRGYGRFSNFDGSIAISSGGHLVLANLATGAEQAEQERVYAGNFRFSEPQLITMSGILAVAAVSEDNYLRIWDVETNEILSNIEVAELPQQVVFSPEADKVAIVGNGVIRLFESTTGETLATLPDFNPLGTDLQFNPDNDVLAATGHDGNTWLWDIQSGDSYAFLDGMGSFSMGSATAFSADGSRLHKFTAEVPWVTALPPLNFQAFDMEGGQEITREKLLGGTNPSSSVNLTAFSPDGSLVAANYGWDGTRIWSVDKLLQGETTALYMIVNQTVNVSGHTAFSRDSRYMALVRWESDYDAGSDYRLTVSLWDTVTWKPLKDRWDFVYPEFNEDYFQPIVAFSPDSEWVIFSSLNGLYTWTLEAGSEPQIIAYREEMPQGRNMLPSYVNDIKFSPDGTILVTMTNSGAQFWDVQQLVRGEASAPFYSWTEEELGVSELAFSDDGKYVATSGGDGIIRLWGVTES